MSIALIPISICIWSIIYDELSTLEMLTKPGVILTMCGVLGLLLLGITASVWMYYAGNNIPVEKMQQKLDAKQPSKGLVAEEQKPPSTIPSNICYS